MTPCGETVFSVVPFRNSLLSVLEPSRALDLTCALLLELQRCKDTIKCAALDADVPEHRHEQLTQTLVIRL